MTMHTPNADPFNEHDSNDHLATLHIQGRVATLTLNRPEKHNALSLDLLEALHARVGALEDSEGVSVLVITGNGKSFCAGMDLKQVMHDAEKGHQLLRSLADLTHRVRTLPMAVVARVHGAAIGGGCGLTCVCDFSLTHDTATLGFPEVDLGLCPAVVAPWVVRRLGAGPARRLLLAGGTLSGQQAAQINLVTQSLPTIEELDHAVAALTTSLSKAGPDALRATKALLNELDGSDNDQVLIRGAQLSAEVLASEDAQQRLRARFGT
jgi:methylglutaconyl-CoA hydratase